MRHHEQSRAPIANDMPMIGLGTWQNDDPEKCAGAVETALETGYRHIDTAQAYGKRFAAIDLYNIWGTAHEVDELVSIVSSVPGQQLADALSSGTSEMSLGLKLKTLVQTFGHWDALYELYKVSRKAEEITRLYNAYPESPEAFATWQSNRDDLMDDLYSFTGAEPKY